MNELTHYNFSDSRLTRAFLAPDIAWKAGLRDQLQMLVDENWLVVHSDKTMTQTPEGWAAYNRFHSLPPDSPPPPMRYKTAWDLCGSSEWHDTYVFRIVGGRTLYESADPVFGERKGDHVVFQRLVSGVHGLRSLRRYVDAETPIELIPFEEMI